MRRSTLMPSRPNPWGGRPFRFPCWRLGGGGHQPSTGHRDCPIRALSVSLSASSSHPKNRRKAVFVIAQWGRSTRGSPKGAVASRTSSAGSTSPGCRPSARLMLVVSRTGRRTSTARLFAGKPRECVRSREVGQPGTTHVSSSGRAAGAARAPGKSFLPIGRMTPLWWRRYNKDHRRGTKRGSCKRDWPVHVQHLPKPPENNE
jgi:hypothetical protein